VLNIKHNYF